jgi:putative SOS response-associated peptidase YedK
MYVNAQYEKASSPFWKRLWMHGRILVPADGWFEWTGEKKERQPHFIYRTDGEPLLLAAISAEEGFVIVTSAAEAGLLDIHDRWPVVLSTAGARAWLDSATFYEEAVEVAGDEALGEHAFTWHAVTRAMGNVKFQDASAVEPIRVE